MTTRKRFKRLVRARAAKTGESYVTALRHFRDTSPPEDPMSHKEDIPMYTEAPLKCSFCGKSQTMVKKVIAGPGVYICDECIVLCVEIIAPSPEERAGLLDRARTPSADSDDEPNALSPDLEREIRRIVGDAVTRTQAAATDAPDTDRSVEVDAVDGVVRVTIRTAYPGLVIGRRGATADDLRSQLAELTGGEVRLNVVPL